MTMERLMGFAGLVLLSGCVTSSHQMTGKVRPQIAPEAVKVYDSAPAGAEEIALIDGADPWRHRMDKVIATMKKEAAQIGANGIVIDRTSVDGWNAAEINGRAIYVP
jgi:hypothetical protein